MKLIFSSRCWFLLALSSSLLLLSACAGMSPAGDGIEKRAMARWEALLSEDLASAYEYLSPGFRSSVSSIQYQRSLILKRVEWTNARYIESECAETTCKVKILLDYVVYGAVPGVESFEGSKEIEESWVKVKGDWYLVPD